MCWSIGGGGGIGTVSITFWVWPASPDPAPYEDALRPWNPSEPRRLLHPRSGHVPLRVCTRRLPFHVPESAPAGNDDQRPCPSSVRAPQLTYPGAHRSLWVCLRRLWWQALSGSHNLWCDPL